jgi:ABC-type uncharacterized transport system ATPase subunit
VKTVLQVEGVAKHFGGIRAVEDVSFDVHEGEILGIIGPNGCGKSTLFNCILGQLTPTSGRVRLDGQDVTGFTPEAMSKRGVSRTFQLLQVFPELSVRENLILAGQEHKGTMLSRLFGPRDAGLTAEAERMIGFFRLGHLADAKAGGLSYGQQKLLDAGIVEKGDRYGRNNCLLHGEDEPLVEVYDAEYPHTEYGQFISRYYMSTLLDGFQHSGIDLMGYEPKWKIDAATW